MIEIHGHGGFRRQLAETLITRLRSERSTRLLLDPSLRRELDTTALPEEQIESIPTGMVAERLAELSQRSSDTLIYLVSGSPLIYSAAAVVRRRLAELLPGFDSHRDLAIFPAHGSAELLAAHFGIDLGREAELATLHGLSPTLLGNFFDRFLRRRYTILYTDQTTPMRIAKLLQHYPLEELQLYYAAALGGPEEHIEKIEPLNQAALAVLASRVESERLPYLLLFEADPALLPSHGQADDSKLDYCRGMISPGARRLEAISGLRLKPGALLWDIGAGSGAVSIDAFLLRRARTQLFENKRERAEQIEINLRRMRIFGAEIHYGDALEKTAIIEESPDAIFVGGGGRRVAETLPQLYRRLSPGGRLLAHYVAIDNLSAAIESCRRAGLSPEIRAGSETIYQRGEPMLIESQRQHYSLTLSRPREIES